MNNSELTTTQYPVSTYLEGYIALRQCFEDPTDYFDIAASGEVMKLGPDLDSAITSGDVRARAALLALPLGRAVSAGTRILKQAGAEELVTSSIFCTKLQVLLRKEYGSAADNIRPENNSIPPFPFKGRRVIHALMHGADSERAVEQVSRLLSAESSS